MNENWFQILNPQQHDQSLANEYNFDHPDAFDMDLMIDVLTKLKEGRKVEVPIYNFITHGREVETVSSRLEEESSNYR